MAFLRSDPEPVHQQPDRSLLRTPPLTPREPCRQSHRELLRLSLSVATIGYRPLASFFPDEIAQHQHIPLRHTPPRSGASERIYSRRASGGDCHHRHARRSPPARRPGRPRGRPTVVVPEQSPPVGHSAAQLRIGKTHLPPQSRVEWRPKLGCPGVVGPDPALAVRGRPHVGCRSGPQSRQLLRHGHPQRRLNAHLIAAHSSAALPSGEERQAIGRRR